MELGLFELLPPRIKKMVEDIEQMTGSEIVVRPRRGDDPALYGARHLPTLDCWMDGKTMHVTVICPTTETLPIHFVIHEILHAWRNIALAVWKLEAANDNDADARRWSALIENDIEHMFIIPLEIQHAPEAASYWESLYWQATEELQEILAFQTRFKRDIRPSLEDLIRHWVVTSAIPQLGCRATLRAMLDQYDCLAPAERMVAEVSEALARADKAQMAALVLAHLGRPRDQYRLARFDVPQATTWFARIPETGSTQGR